MSRRRSLTGGLGSTNRQKSFDLTQESHRISGSRIQSLLAKLLPFNLPLSLAK